MSPSPTPLVLASDSSIADAPALAGAKAATLARLRLAGLPVPRLSVVTTAGFLAHLHSNAISVTVGADSGARPDAIRRALLSAPMPESVHAATVAAYQVLSLPAAGPAPVAVRSSGVAEDGLNASFAGQFDSFLGVRGDERVVQSVKDCWASYLSDRSMNYRAARRVTENAPLIAVILQRQIFAVKAGVLFTRHPVAADPSLAYIEANFGTGESVVGGLVTPDSITMSRDTMMIVDRMVADKSTMTVVAPDAAGSSTIATPADLVNKPVLTASEAWDLLDAALRIERELGAPQDIEWAIDGTQMWIIQARPITAAGSLS